MPLIIYEKTEDELKEKLFRFRTKVYAKKAPRTAFSAKKRSKGKQWPQNKEHNLDSKNQFQSKEEKGVGIQSLFKDLRKISKHSLLTLC